MRKLLIVPLLALGLTACVSYDTRQGDGIPRARIGQGIDLGDFEVMPQQVLEDSRCPTGVTCVWAGQVRLKVRIDFPGGVDSQELTLGKALPVGPGTLTLVEANPYPEQDKTIYPEDYRFGFTYVRTRAVN
jgi:hypothetical protein